MMEELKCAYAGVTAGDVDGYIREEDEDEQTPLIEEYRLRQDPTDAQLDYIGEERAQLLEKYYSDASTIPEPRQDQVT
jgi:hypothetical protein